MSTPSSPTPMTPRPVLIPLSRADASSPYDRCPVRSGPSSFGRSLNSSGGRSWQGGQSLGRAKVGRQFGLTPIHSLPDELLLHIFALLPPYALVASQLVCQSWNRIVQDEAAWRNAFERYYNIQSDQGLISLGRRLEPSSWKLEYVTRVRLLHRWHKSRTPTLVHNPNLGPLSSIHFNFPPAVQPATSAPSRSQPPQPTMLSVSLSASTAIKSVPFTGKLSPKLLTATPTDNLGWPVGLPLMPATSYAVTHDGGKIVWGMDDGTLRVLGCGSQLNGRGWAGGAANAGDVQPMEAHLPGTAVSCLAFSTVSKFPPAQTRTDLFASVGVDGAVNIWSLVSAGGGGLARERPRPAFKLWTAEVETRRAGDTLRDRVSAVEGCCVAFDGGWGGRKGRKATLAVGMTNGVVHIWSGLDLDVPASAFTYQKIEPMTNEVGSAVETLVLDPPTAPGAQGSILVHHADSATFHRHSLGETPSHIAFNNFPDLLGPITAIATDFDDPPLTAAVPSTAGAVRGFEVFSTPQTPLEAPATNGVLPTSPSLASVDSFSLGLAGGAQGGALHGASLFGRTKYVVAGDAQGRVYIWDWEEGQHEEHDQSFVREVKPRRLIQGAESRVTALTITPAAVLVGSLDGTVRIYDPLSSTLLRTFKERSASRIPARLLAQGVFDTPEEERWMVKGIKADREGLVVNVGGKILAWRVKEEIHARKAKTGKSGKGRLSARVERFRSEQELRHQVQDSLSTLSLESADRVEQYATRQRVDRDFGLPQSLDGLTEEEAVSLALMLSMDENGVASERWVDGEWDEGESGRTEDWDGEEDDDGWQMDGVDESVASSTGRSFGNRRASHAGSVADTDDHPSTAASPIASPRVGSLSTSLSVPQSPFLRGSFASSSPTRDWNPTSPPLAPYQPYSYSPGANHKIQLSPRLSPVYGAQVAPIEEVPDLDDEVGFPSMAGASPYPSAQGKGKQTEAESVSTPAKKGWNAVAASPGSADASPSPSAWSASASGGGAWSASPSHLSRQMSSAPNTPSKAPAGPFLHDVLRESAEDARRKQEEDELAFVLQLSLAEEASRRDL